MTTIHPFADNAGDATPQKRSVETKSLSLLQRTLSWASVAVQKFPDIRGRFDGNF